MSTSLPVTHPQAIDLVSSLDRDILSFLVKIAVLDSGKDEIQEEIVKELTRILVIDSCTLYLRDESTDHWVIQKTFSADGLWTSHVVPIDKNTKEIITKKTDNLLIFDSSTFIWIILN